jgi:polar amino acid transport system substrate-binding protein
VSTRAHVTALGLALALVALALATTATGSPETSAVVKGCAPSTLPLKTPGKLTLATDTAARRPWWSGTPATGQGFESALAYALAKRLGFSKAAVTWTQLSPEQATQPGTKGFDFYVGQVRYAPALDRNIDFSAGYYRIPQALLSRRGYTVAGARTLAQVRPNYIGVVENTASHRYTVRYVKPFNEPVVFSTMENALDRLIRGFLTHGLVVDLPTAYVLRARVPNGVIVGQFLNKGSRDRFALVFEQGSQLRGCVNKALGQLHANGTVTKLRNSWLTPAGGQRILR